MNKYQIIAQIFSKPIEETTPIEPLEPLQHGKYYGGIYKGKKYMYSQQLIDSMSPEKLEKFIKKQIGMI